MNNIENARKLTEALIAAPVSIITDIPSSLAVFEKDHCFNTSFQPIYTVPYLSGLIEEMAPNTIYEIHEPLQTSIVLFSLGDSYVIIGPFANSEWNNLQSETVFASLGINISQLNAYKMYRCRYAIYNPLLIHRVIAFLLGVSGKEMTDYSFVTVNKIHEITSEIHHYDIDAKTITDVDRRYSIEKRLMDAMKDGKTIEAKSALAELLSTPSQRISFVNLAQFNPITSATILRTIIRIAAMQTSLPSVLIDTISQDYAQKLYSSTYTGGLKRINEISIAFLNELCEKIDHIQNTAYSSLIRKAISYIDLNLGNDISLSKIAEDLSVSVGHLSKSFKEETGETVNHYITRSRINKAADMLVLTQFPIQDICAFVGYLDNNYFVKVFKSQYHMTPSEFRKKHSR